MGEHLISGEFQSDKYPTCPRGKVPLSTKDPMAQDLLWKYAQRRRKIDPEFSEDLEEALELSGFITTVKNRKISNMKTLNVIIHYLKKDKKFLEDYQGITIKDDKDITIVRYGNQGNQGNEKASGFIDGITYVFPDLTVEYKNVADYKNEEAWINGTKYNIRKIA